MSTQLDPHQQPQPPIDVRTLGRFEVLVHGVQKIWKGRNAGAKQIERVVGYLVFRRDHPVERTVLTRVAGGHGDGDRRYVIADVVQQLKHWGLDVALRLQRSHMTLLRHPVWDTDTDRLDALFEKAQSISESGQQEQAIEILEAAEALCNGEYLSIFAPHFDPAIDGAKGRWKNVQKQTLVLKARLCMAMPDLKRREQAFDAATTAIKFDKDDPATYWLASDCARLWGNLEVAHDYAQQALAIEQKQRQKS